MTDFVVHVVDDDAAVRDSLGFVLGAADWRVRTFESALELLKHIDTLERGLIITDVRSDPDAIASEVLVSLPRGGAIPLGEVATVVRTQGPTGVRTEDGQLAVYVFIDVRDRDLGGYVEEARQAVASAVAFPPGYYATWSGQFEYMERAIYALIKQWRLRGGGEE